MCSKFYKIFGSLFDQNCSKRPIWMTPICVLIVPFLICSFFEPSFAAANGTDATTKNFTNDSQIYDENGEPNLVCVLMLTMASDTMELIQNGSLKYYEEDNRAPSIEKNGTSHQNERPEPQRVFILMSQPAIAGENGSIANLCNFTVIKNRTVGIFQNISLDQNHHHPIDLSEYVKCVGPHNGNPANEIVVDYHFAKKSLVYIECESSRFAKFNFFRIPYEVTTEMLEGLSPEDQAWKILNLPTASSSVKFSMEYYKWFPSNTSNVPYFRFLASMFGSDLDASGSLFDCTGVYAIGFYKDIDNKNHTGGEVPVANHRSLPSFLFAIEISNETTITKKNYTQKVVAHTRDRPYIVFSLNNSMELDARNKSEIVFTYNGYCLFKDFDKGNRFWNIGGRNPGECLSILVVQNQKCRDDTLCIAQGVVTGGSFLDSPTFRILKNILQDGLLMCGHFDTNQNITVYFTALNLVPTGWALYRISKGEGGPAPDPLIRLRMDDHVTEYVGDFGFHMMAHDSNKSETRSLDLFTGQKYEFECLFVSFMLSLPIIWRMDYDNGTHMEVYQWRKDFRIETVTVTAIDDSDQEVKRQFKFFVSKHILVVNETDKNLNNFSCTAYLWDSTQFVRSSYQLNVKESSAPILQKAGETKSHSAAVIMKQVGDEFKFTCHLQSGQPNVMFYWRFDNQSFENNTKCRRIRNVEGRMTILEFCNAVTQHSGQYTCIARNFLGSDEKTFRLRVVSNSKDWIYYTTMGVLLLIFSIFGGLAYKKFRRQRVKLTAMEIELFIKGNKNHVTGNGMFHQVAQYLPYDSQYEVSLDDWIFEKYLDSGEFGIVMKGKLKGVDMAAKTVRPDADKMALQSLLSELKILMHLEKHEHIIHFVAAHTGALDQGQAYIFVEFCELGSLENFIKKNKNLYMDKTDDGGGQIKMELTRKCGNYFEMLPKTFVGYANEEYGRCQDFFIWSHQIANGMKFLGSKNVVHADLATRNVLLKSVHHVKITDFGLSKLLEAGAAYKKKSQTLVPWTLMALESLRDGIFTSQSDVWSFGVTVWEIFSLGCVPFGGLNWCPEFVSSLEQGHRLSKPLHATDSVYNMLLSCWAEDPGHRPSFGQLEQFFLTELEILYAEIKEI